MTRIITSLSDVSTRYRALYCDLWGCVHNGHAAYPAAVAALVGFRATGGRVVLLTNAPRPAHAVASQLDRLGVPRDAWDLIVSSGDAAQYAMLSGVVGRKIWHLGPDKDEGFFSDPPADAHGKVERVSFEEAEGIVCTGPFDELTETPEDYRGRFLHAKARGLKLLCANPDIVVDYGDRRIYCAGALAALYTEMGGESLYFGKPHPPIYDLARNRLAALTGVAIDNDSVLVVGDGIDTDIRGAEAESIDALFVTGGLATAAFGADAANPDPVRLKHWLEARGTDPAYSIGRLC